MYPSYYLKINSRLDKSICSREIMPIKVDRTKSKSSEHKTVIHGGGARGE